MPFVSCELFTNSQLAQDIKIDSAIAKNIVQDTSIAQLQTAQSTAAAGFNAAALAAIPTSTDTVVGKSRSATPLETGAGVLNDGVHVSPADLLAAARTATTFAAAIAANPNKYGTFASVLAPTLAPTEANPQTILTNSNGEVFQYTGTKWVLIANGFIVANTGSPQIVLADGAYHVVNSIIVPRDGVVEIEAYVIFENAQAQAKYITIAFDVGFGQGFSGNTNVNPISPFDNLGVFGIKSVTAGQVIPLSVLVYTTNAPIKGSGITLTYTR
jgi:hypothetical protein